MNVVVIVILILLFLLVLLQEFLSIPGHGGLVLTVVLVLFALASSYASLRVFIFPLLFVRVVCWVCLWGEGSLVSHAWLLWRYLAKLWMGLT